MSLAKKPEWLKIRIPSGEKYAHIKKTLRENGLHTVCEEASCPNIAECWGSGTSTIMIMGDTCTRGCRFCDVTTGRPLDLDPSEPQRVAKTVRSWNLRYVVITSVCRDDLPDGGASHFAHTISAIKEESPQTVVEPLIPDFDGNREDICKITDTKPKVVSHNIETVQRLSSRVRDSRANYYQSLRVLKMIKDINPSIYTKSSLMLGHGETKSEVVKTAQDLIDVGVDIITAGQYLQPSLRHLPVSEFVRPEKFVEYKKIFEDMGFLFVAAGPFVRSSYRASDFIEKMGS